MINQISDKIVFSGLKLIKYGKLNVTTFQNKKLQFGDDGNLEVSIKINKPDFSRNIISKGSIGLAESYMRRDFETDDLSKLIELSAKNIKLVHKFSGILDLTYLNYFKKFINRNTKTKSKEHISKHYDLGNEFFSLWLDDTLTYSSAIFENEKSNLYEAQINKYKKLSNLLKPKSGDKLLEIGCGWGGFAEYIGKNHDVNLDCITISKKQYEFATSFLKVGDYGTAERAFREFVVSNPDHELAGSAQYWYAETFRIRQLYTDAASAYLEGYQKYPKGKKAPINLLKLGVSMVQIGEKDQGCKMINGVELQYPNANQSVIQKAKYESKKFECIKQDS